MTEKKHKYSQIDQGIYSTYETSRNIKRLVNPMQRCLFVNFVSSRMQRFND